MGGLGQEPQATQALKAGAREAAAAWETLGNAAVPKEAAAEPRRTGRKNKVRKWPRIAKKMFLTNHALH